MFSWHVLSKVELQNDKLPKSSKPQVKSPSLHVFFLTHANFPFDKKEETTANNMLLIHYFIYEKTLFMLRFSLNLIMQKFCNYIYYMISLVIFKCFLFLKNGRFKFWSTGNMTPGRNSLVLCNNDHNKENAVQKKEREIKQDVILLRQKKLSAWAPIENVRRIIWCCEICLESHFINIYSSLYAFWILRPLIASFHVLISWSCISQLW